MLLARDTKHEEAEDGATGNGVTLGAAPPPSPLYSKYPTDVPTVPGMGYHNKALLCGAWLL